MKLFKKLVRSLYKRLWKDEWNEKRYIYQASRLCSEYISKQWHVFFNNNDFSLKTDLLTKNLDPQSIKEVKTILERMKLFTFCNEYPDKLYINVDTLYTEEEKQEQKDSKKSIKQYKKCFPVKFFEPSVLCAHSGLKLIPFVVDYIKDKDFIDGGACIGDSAFIFEKYYNPASVYAFEPLKGNIEYINKTIKMNNLKHVKPVKSGLGDKEEEIDLTYNPNDISGTSFSYNNQNASIKEKINITTIDNYVKNNNLNLGLIKLDVEGYESNVINGALDSIKKYRPVMLISIYHNPKDFFEIKPLIESLNLNYKFKVKKCSPNVLYCETLLLCYPAELEKE